MVVWTHEGICRGWFSTPYLGGCRELFEVEPATEGGWLTIRARGDYTPGGEEGIPEAIAIDLDGIYASVEDDFKDAYFGDGNIETCPYPGIFPALEAYGLTAPPPFCIPMAGPDTGATIIGIHDPLEQDVEWTQTFWLDADGLYDITRDRLLQIDLSTLGADLWHPSYITLTIDYAQPVGVVLAEVAEPGTLALLALALVMLRGSGRSRAGSRTETLA